MKKIIYCICFVFLWSIFSNFTCDQCLWYYGEWRINNTTTQTLIIELVRTRTEELLESCRIKPESTKCFSRQELHFDFGFEEFANPFSARVSKLVVKSENGDTLKTWTYDQHCDAGRQFYDEEYWSYTVDPNGYKVWEFSILPEDLAIQE